MRHLKRFATAFLLLAALLCISAPPALADVFTLQGTQAQTTSGNGTTTDIGNWRHLHVLVRVTAGSGTVNPFRIWLEGSPDNGNTWFEVPCALVVKGGATAPGTSASQRDIVNEVAVVTSATYLGTCDVFTQWVRAAWNIAGTTPSETFQVRAATK
jgi:hypothetical protein